MILWVDVVEVLAFHKGHWQMGSMADGLAFALQTTEELQENISFAKTVQTR